MTIKEARTKAKWSQATLAQKLEIPKRSIENWETGARKIKPWIEKLIVAEILRQMNYKQ